MKVRTHTSWVDIYHLPASDGLSTEGACRLKETSLKVPLQTEEEITLLCKLVVWGWAAVMCSLTARTLTLILCEQSGGTSYKNFHNRASGTG